MSNQINEQLDSQRLQGLSLNAHTHQAFKETSARTAHQPHEGQQEAQIKSRVGALQPGSAFGALQNPEPAKTQAND